MRVNRQPPIKWTQQQQMTMKQETHDMYRIGLSSDIALKEEQIKYHNRVMFITKLKKLYKEPYRNLGNMKKIGYLIQRRELSMEKWNSYEWRMRILKELFKRKAAKKWPNIRRQFVTLQETESNQE